LEDFIATYKDILIVTLGFLIIAVASFQVAKKFQWVQLPLITGLIFTGILAGPHLLDLVHTEAKEHLQFINEIALAFIAFAAGSELYLRELRSRFKSIKWNTFGQLVVTFVAGSMLVYFAADYIPYMAGLGTKAKIAISTITAAIFVARSPASAIAVINELRAKGPFVQTVMGVTVVKDFLVIVLFSVCMALAETMISGEQFNFYSVLFILLDLGLSFVIGFYVYGWIMKVVMSFRIDRRAKTILVLLVGYTAYVLYHSVRELSFEMIGHSIHLEPLMMCILASFYVTNYTKYRPEFIHILDKISFYIYVVFFTLTGATLAIDVIGSVIWVTLILFGIRMITMIVGAYVGGILAGDPMKQNHLGWMPYVTQAGVGLGLATVVANEFPEWGEQFATVIVSVIVINQFIGPPLFKYAIFKLGENRTRGIPGDYEGVKDALIFGYESQSVALARQLTDKGWNVKIATKLTEGSLEEPERIEMVYGLKECSKEELDKADAEEAGVIVCMLTDDENLKICETAYQHYGTRDLVVRLNHRYNNAKFLELDAKVVYPDTAIVSLMDHFVRSPQAASLLLGMEKGQDTLDIEITNTDIHGITLRDLRLPGDVIILSVVRAGTTIITHGYTRLRYKDIVTVVGSPKSIKQVQMRFEA